MVDSKKILKSAEKAKITDSSSDLNTDGEGMPSRDTLDGSFNEGSSESQSPFLFLKERITGELTAKFPNSIIEVRQNDGGSVSVYVDKVKVFDMEKTQQLLNHLLAEEGSRDETSRP